MSSHQNRCYELRDSNRVGRSLFATRSIPFGTLILSDSDVLMKFSAENTTPLNDLLQFWDVDFDGNIISASASDPHHQQQQQQQVEAKHFIAKYKSLPALTLSAVAVINQTCEKIAASLKNPNAAHDRARLLQIWQHIKNMHSPALPISADTFLMYQSCAKLLELKQREIDYNSLECDVCKEISSIWSGGGGGESSSSSSSTSDAAAAAIVHAVMALKTNAHRASDNDWCLYPMASKFAHSCDPNCYFIPPSAANNFTASFVSVKNSIEKGEVLSFSYLGGPALTLSTNQRRRRLQRSHLFVCRCSRCDECEDNAAAAVVAASAIYVRLSCPLGFCEADLEHSSSTRKGIWRRVGGNSVMMTTTMNGGGADEKNSSAAPLYLNDNHMITASSILFSSDKYNPQSVFLHQDESRAFKVKYSSIVAAIQSLIAKDNIPPILDFSSISSPNIAKALLHRKYFLAQPLICEACRHAVSYFATMCNISIRAAASGLVPKTKPKITPFQLLFCWTMKYFSCLEAMGILNRQLVVVNNNRATNGDYDLPTSDFAQETLTRLSDPPHMLVVQTAVTLIDLCLQHHHQNQSPGAAAATTSTNNDNHNNSSSSIINLVPDATPATGILAVLAHHCRSFVAATILKNGNNNNSKEDQHHHQEKKLAKIDLLCELETDTFVAIKDCPLMMCLEMSCADELWKWMAFGNESGLCKKKGVFDPANEFKQLLEGWDS